MVIENTLSKHDFKLKGQVGSRGIGVLIRVQEIISRQKPYHYVEIGSYLGKSLQPHIQDKDCEHALSIDLRPELTPDERGDMEIYKHISTQDMIDGLLEYCDKKDLEKLETRDTNSDILRDWSDRRKFDLAFIDGEHTVEGAFRDFLNLQHVMKKNSIIVFDDSHIIYPALRNAFSYLESRNQSYVAKFGSGYITPIFIGEKAVKWAEDFSDDLCWGEKFILKKYRENMGKRYVGEYMTTMLRSDSGTIKKAVRVLKRKGFKVEGPDE